MRTRLHLSTRALAVGLVVNAILAAVKFTTGICGHSNALIADGIESFSDIVTSLVVWHAIVVSMRPADARHPYGHGRAETLAVVTVSVVLMAAALIILMRSISEIQTPHHAPAPYTLVVLLVVVAVKEGLYRFVGRVGGSIESGAVMADAWHHRSDAIASFAALIGIAGALMGWPIFDPVAAIGVAFFVGKVGVDIAVDSLKELTDAATAIDKEIHDTIQRLINEHPEVHSAHLVKARRMGPDIMVDVHVVVDAFLSVSEGHQIADEVEKKLIRQVSEVSSVMVHVDTSDDLETESDMSEGAERIVETRTQIRERLNNIGPLEPPLREVHEVIPHYTPKGIVAEVFLTADVGANMDQVRESARRLGRRLREAHKDFANVRLHLFLGEDRGDVVA